MGPRSPGEEEGVSAQVPPDLGRVVLVRVELLPHAGRVDVLVALVPPPVDHLGKGRIVADALQESWVGQRALDPAACAIICRSGGRGGGGRIILGRRLGAVVEQQLAAGADLPLHDEVVELEVLGG